MFCPWDGYIIVPLLISLFCSDFRNIQVPRSTVNCDRRHGHGCGLRGVSIGVVWGCGCGCSMGVSTFVVWGVAIGVVGWFVWGVAVGVVWGQFYRCGLWAWLWAWYGGVAMAHSPVSSQHSVGSKGTQLRFGHLLLHVYAQDK